MTSSLLVLSTIPGYTIDRTVFWRGQTVEEKITIERMTAVVEPGTDPTPSQYGYVIDKDGRIYSMVYRFTHGVILALLHPDVAEKQGVEAPVGPIDELDVRAYQNFEHDVSRDLPNIRIAHSFLSGGVYISKGKFPATNVQIDSVRRALLASGYSLRDTLTGEEGDQTIGQFLNVLREERAREMDFGPEGDPL
jgi:hypothetical protein